VVAKRKISTLVGNRKPCCSVTTMTELSLLIVPIILSINCIIHQLPKWDKYSVLFHISYFLLILGVGENDISQKCGLQWVHSHSPGNRNENGTPSNIGWHTTTKVQGAKSVAVQLRTAQIHLRSKLDLRGRQTATTRLNYDDKNNVNRHVTVRFVNAR